MANERPDTSKPPTQPLQAPAPAPVAPPAQPWKPEPNPQGPANPYYAVAPTTLEMGAWHRGHGVCGVPLQTLVSWGVDGALGPSHPRVLRAQAALAWLAANPAPPPSPAAARPRPAAPKPLARKPAPRPQPKPAPLPAAATTKDDDMPTTVIGCVRALRAIAAGSGKEAMRARAALEALNDGLDPQEAEQRALRAQVFDRVDRELGISKAPGVRTERNTLVLSAAGRR